LLLKRNSGGQTVDGIHFRHSHLVKQAPGVGGDRFEIPPLRFRVEGPESQRRFAGTGNSGKDNQGVAREGHIYILEIVFPRAPHLNEAVILHYSPNAVSQLPGPNKDLKVWFSLGENHEKAYRFGLHQLRTAPPHGGAF
jgi:hypothetical protein